MCIEYSIWNLIFLTLSLAILQSPGKICITHVYYSLCFGYCFGAYAQRVTVLARCVYLAAKRFSISLTAENIAPVINPSTKN